MNNLIIQVTRLRDTAKKYEDEVCKLPFISTTQPAPQSECFAMVFNHLTLTLELLSHYHSIWSKPRIVLTEDEKIRIRKENGQRCVLITKWLFVDSLSSIEYSAKVVISHYDPESSAKKLLKSRSRYVYLRDIIRNSWNEKLISINDYQNWDNIIKLRNYIVHNNAIADIDTTIEVREIKLIGGKGNQFQGNLNSYATLTEVVVEQYLTWLKALIKEYGT